MDSWERAERCAEAILARIAELELQARFGYPPHASPPKVKGEIAAVIGQMLESLEDESEDSG